MVRPFAARVSALVFAVLLAAGVLSFGTGQAHATYQWFWGGLTMTDTEAGNCNLNDTNANTYDCYTWIQKNGNVRRGSPAQYLAEAQGGFVYILCSSAVAHTNSDISDLYRKDFWGVAAAKHFHWVAYPWTYGSPEYSYCNSPIAGSGATPWTNYAWSMIPNGLPY